MSNELRIHTRQLTVAASTAGTRFTPTRNGFFCKQAILTAKMANTGTLYVGGSEATLRKGIPLTRGQSVNFNSIPLASQSWMEVDVSTLYVWSTVANNHAILTYYGE